MSPSFTGVIPPVVTPLTDDGDVDTASLARLVEFLIDGGADGLFALGSSGETAYLTDEAADRVLDVIVSTAAGQVPVLAGAIATSTDRVVQRGHAVRRAGAAAVVATAPFYARTSLDETGRHFRAVADGVGLPLLAYDVPVSVGHKLDPGLVLELAADRVLAGLKDSSGDDVAFRRLVLSAARDAPDFAMLTGHEVVVDGALLAGAHGCVPGLGNVDPHGYRRLVDAAGRGEWTVAKAEQDRLAQLFDIVFLPRDTVSDGAAGVGAFKTALMLRGVIAGNTVSRPMRALGETHTAAIAKALAAAGLR